MLKRLLTLCMLLIPFVVSAQNIDRENFSVKYLRLPKTPLPENIKTYNKNLHVPSLSSDQSRSSIESSVKKAMTLGGYEQVDAEGDIEIYVSLGTFNFINRQFNSEKKQSKDKEGKVTTWYEYWYTFEYKYPVHLVIRDRMNDQELFNRYVNSSQDYSAASTGRVRSSDALKSEWNKTISKMRGSLLNTHLNTVSGYISDNYGFTPSTQSVQLRKIKKYKKHDFTDLNQACSDVEVALKKMEPEMDYLTEELKMTLESAIAVWEKDLAEADYADKKARVNEKVASVLLNNIAVANYWLINFDKVTEMITKADGLKSDGWTSTLKSQMDERVSRRTANGLD